MVLFAFFAIALHDDGFTSSDNLLNIIRQTAPITVMAVATVFVLGAGEIDLSIGSVVALSALVTAEVLREQAIVLAVAGRQPVYMNVFPGRELVRGPLRRRPARCCLSSTSTSTAPHGRSATCPAAGARRWRSRAPCTGRSGWC